MEPVFRCDHCHDVFDLEAFSSAVDQYGLILLRGKKDGFYGTLCPKCKRTSLIRRPINLIESNVLGLIATSDGDRTSHILHYESFPYTLEHHKEEIPGGYITLDLDGERGSFTGHVNSWDPIIKNGSISVGPGEYCSCQANDLAVGPLMTVWWFKGDDIPEIVKTENETGIKVFPRYICARSLYSRLKKYCFANYLELKIVKLGIIEDYDYLGPLDSNPWRRRINLNYEFLDMLSCAPPGSEAFTVVKGKQIPADVELTVFVEGESSFRTDPGFFFFDEVAAKDSQTSERSGAQNESGRDRPSIKVMSEKVWARFTDKSVQDLLTGMSPRLIHSFIELSNRIDFSIEEVWKCNANYLEELYRAVESPFSAISLRNDLQEEELREVREAEDRFPGVNIVSDDPLIGQIKIEISKMASVNIPGVSFLLLGESGTGKELFAKAIHEASGREGPYIVSDCGAKSETLFESQLFGHLKGAFTGAINDKKGDFELAEGGTIFLDEIGNLAPSLQPKMLRVLREREIQPLGAVYSKKVDVKVVLGTNRDLAKMVEEGRFMNDLYQRFKRPQFLIPPLRERKGDIPRLVEHFLEEYDTFRTADSSIPAIIFTSECLAILAEYEWRDGNIGELEKVILEIMLKRGGGQDRRDITPYDLPEEISEGGRGDCSSAKDRQKQSWPPSDEELLALEREGKKRTKVAEMFGVERETVSRAYSRIRRGLVSEVKNSGG